MSVERIEFSLVHGTEEDFPRPYPANKEIPDWYKALPAEVEIQGKLGGSVKNCPPFFEALTCGYILPLAADITLSRDKAGVFHGQGPTFPDRSSTVPRTAQMVSSHQQIQVKGSPMEQFPIVKIHNPWLIRTSPGYSTLFQAPLNRFQMHLFPIAGLVETDVFYREINIPGVLTIPPGTTLKLKRGTPLVQVIPVRRDDFQSEVVPLDVDQYQVFVDKKITSQNHNYYRDEHWRKKSYR